MRLMFETNEAVIQVPVYPLLSVGPLTVPNLPRPSGLCPKIEDMESICTNHSLHLLFNDSMLMIFDFALAV